MIDYGQTDAIDYSHDECDMWDYCDACDNEHDLSKPCDFDPCKTCGHTGSESDPCQCEAIYWPENDKS